MMLFLIGALRAIVEMLGLCLIAQGILFVLAGPSRDSNPIYQLFVLITRAPRTLVARLMPTGVSPKLVSIVCFCGLFVIWFGLAVLRKFI